MSDELAAYWLIAVPKNASGEDNLTTLKRKCSQEKDLCYAYRFNVPNTLRVGTLDGLMSLSDALVKVDPHIESVCRRVRTLLHTVLDDGGAAAAVGGGASADVNAAVAAALTAPRGADIHTFATKFTWNESTFPSKTPLRTLVTIMEKRCAKVEDGAKAKAAEYNNLVQQEHASRRRTGGNLLVRDLDADLVKPDQNVVSSENLTTLLVVVPLSQCKAFEKTYEEMTQFVVPRSAKKITADKEFALYRVVLFKRVADDFRNAVREARWTVRDYSEKSKSSTESARLADDKDKLRKQLIRWCKSSFADVYSCYMHIKAVRTFVEAALRYCPPPNFDAMLLQPHARTHQKLQDTLAALYKHHTSERALGGDDDDDALAAGGGIGRQKFRPYVYTEVCLDFS